MWPAALQGLVIRASPGKMSSFLTILGSALRASVDFTFKRYGALDLSGCACLTIGERLEKAPVMAV